MALSPHSMELRKRRLARAQRLAREMDEMQRKKDEDDRMQRTLKELEEQRQVIILLFRQHDLCGYVLLILPVNVKFFLKK